MKLRERLSHDDEELWRTMLDGHQATMWTMLPGIIESYDPVAMTATVRSAIKGELTKSDDTVVVVTMPPMPNVPVVFPRGGGYTMTFPIQPDDECMIVFASRCIDNWWQSGEVSEQFEHRLHDLSDGICLVGPFSQKTKLANVSTTTAQFRSDDQSVMVELDKDQGVASITAPTKIVLNSPLVEIPDGDVVAGTVSLRHHIHDQGGHQPVGG